MCNVYVFRLDHKFMTKYALNLRVVKTNQISCRHKQLKEKWIWITHNPQWNVCHELSCNTSI